MTIRNKALGCSEMLRSRAGVYLGRSRMAEFRHGQGDTPGVYCIHHFFFFPVGEVLSGQVIWRP